MKPVILLRISGQLQGGRVEGFPEGIIRGKIVGGNTVPAIEFFVQQFVIRWVCKEVVGADRLSGQNPLLQGACPVQRVREPWWPVGWLWVGVLARVVAACG